MSSILTPTSPRSTRSLFATYLVNQDEPETPAPAEPDSPKTDDSSTS
jgi:hypothetical protein